MISLTCSGLLWQLNLEEHHTAITRLLTEGNRLYISLNKWINECITHAIQFVLFA